MIGARIRELRRKRGWSQAQLGAMIGFSQSKISKIEHGDWDSLSDLKLLAAALEVKIEELMKDETVTRLFTCEKPARSPIYTICRVSHAY